MSTEFDRFVDVVTFIRAELGGPRRSLAENPTDSPSYDANRAYLGRIKADKKAIENLDNMRKSLPKKPPGRA